MRDRLRPPRLAERAGVSVGSLYQYFPNKFSMLFRLQADERRRTPDLMRGILEDAAAAPPDRVRRLVRAFIESGFEEAQIRLALGDAAPLLPGILARVAARSTTPSTMISATWISAGQSERAIDSARLRVSGL